MFKHFRSIAAILALMVPVFFAGMQAAQPQNSPKLHRYVIQVSRDDMEGMNLAMGNALNAKALYDTRHEQFQVEIVAYGPGITMFRADNSPVKDRIEQIHKNIPNCHLVMHGSSSVPQDLIEIINKYSGKIKETYGVPVAEIRPVSDRPRPRMPDREALIMGGPETVDSGLILEQDRT